MGRHLSHWAWLVPLAFSIGSPAVADPDLSKVRKAGGYVILSDGQGKAISGAYWLSPDLKIVVHSENSAAPVSATYVDREMFPHRIAQFERYLNARVTYDPEPASLAVGKVAQIRQTEQFSGPFSVSPPKTLPLAFATTGIVASKLQNVDLVSRIYSADGEVFSIPGRKPGRRVYVETLDIDLSAADAANVAGIETGEAISSGDFHAHYIARAVPFLPKVAKCFEEVRFTREFQAAARKQHDTADQWMATIFVSDGKSWWDREKVSPEDFGPDVSSLCLDP